MPSSSHPQNLPNEDANAPRIAELVGATASPVVLGAVASKIEVVIQPPTGPALLRGDGQPRRVFLNVEHITAAADAPSYDVYLNLPPGEEPARHPELRAGTMAMFGLIEASRPQGAHPANGLTYKFDITGVYARLRARMDWDAGRLQVSFVPEPWPASAKVQVGRVSIYFE